VWTWKKGNTPERSLGYGLCEVILGGLLNDRKRSKIDPKDRAGRRSQAANKAGGCLTWREKFGQVARVLDEQTVKRTVRGDHRTVLPSNRNRSTGMRAQGPRSPDMRKVKGMADKESGGDNDFVMTIYMRGKKKSPIREGTPCLYLGLQGGAFGQRLWEHSSSRPRKERNKRVTNF